MNSIQPFPLALSLYRLTHMLLQVLIFIVVRTDTGRNILSPSSSVDANRAICASAVASSHSPAWASLIEATRSNKMSWEVWWVDWFVDTFLHVLHQTQKPPASDRLSVKLSLSTTTIMVTCHPSCPLFMLPFSCSLDSTDGAIDETHVIRKIIDFWQSTTQTGSNSNCKWKLTLTCPVEMRSCCICECENWPGSADARKSCEKCCQVCRTEEEKKHLADISTNKAHEKRTDAKVFCDAHGIFDHANGHTVMGYISSGSCSASYAHANRSNIRTLSKGQREWVNINLTSLELSLDLCVSLQLSRRNANGRFCKCISTCSHLISCGSLCTWLERLVAMCRPIDQPAAEASLMVDAGRLNKLPVVMLHQWCHWARRDLTLHLAFSSQSIICVRCNVTCVALVIHIT